MVDYCIEICHLYSENAVFPGYSLVLNTSHGFFLKNSGELLHGHNSVNFQQILMGFLGMLLIGLEKVLHKNHCN